MLHRREGARSGQVVLIVTAQLQSLDVGGDQRGLFLQSIGISSVPGGHDFALGSRTNKGDTPMTLHLRQVALVAKKLQPVLDDLCAILGLEVCFVDEEVGVFGLENSLLPVGTNFIEVVAPVKAGTAAGRYLERRNGDGGYMVITQADGQDDQAAHRDRATQLGIRVAWERAHNSGRFMQLHPADTGGAFFEIDFVNANDPIGDWPPAGGSEWKKHVRPEIISAITAVEIQADTPVILAERWAAIAATKLDRDAAGRIILRLNNAVIRFVADTDGRGEGLGGIDVKVEDRAALLAAAKERDRLVNEDQVMICGVRFNLVE